MKVMQNTFWRSGMTTVALVTVASNSSTVRTVCTRRWCQCVGVARLKKIHVSLVYFLDRDRRDDEKTTTQI